MFLGHDYKFRVSALNSQGESQPLETLQLITAKEPYDTPGKTGKPEIVDWSKNHADLKWTLPDSDGGAPIESYFVEVREQFAPQWKKALEVSPESNSATVPNLTPGKEYEFRIIAKVIFTTIIHYYQKYLE